VTALRTGLDIVVDVLAAAMWSLAAFFIAARVLDSTIGLILAFAVFVTALTFVATSRAQEQRARNLARGACPRCRDALKTEHEHRRWDAANRQWLPPVHAWRCSSCGFQQEEALACELCPA
jgi:hypothetical protein